MILRDWIKMLGLRRELRKKRRDLNGLQTRLLNQGVPEEEITDHLVEGMHEVDRVHSEIENVRTGQLTLKAISLGLEPPPIEWMYTRNVKYPNHTVQVSTLTTLGESKLRRNILLEKRMRAEFWLKVIPPMVTAVTGLLGTLIGVLAILRATK